MLSLANLAELLRYNSEDPLLFNSKFFLVFFILFLFIYQFTYAKPNQRVWVVTSFSLYFFYKACGWYVSCIIIAAIVDFYLSTIIYNSRSAKRKKGLLIISIVANLGLLCCFKYTNLFIQTINDLQLGNIRPISIMLPIGISFYTFENLSYTIDVYKGKFKPVTRFMDYLFFLSFFPKLMMGPIVRAADFIPQIRGTIQFTRQQHTEGLYLILMGIIKKVIISDYLYANLVERIFNNPSLYTGTECLLATYGYAMVIYCDFSGYSSMAIGMAKWMGFTINENFNAPYKSSSITEFWRRWHISLSSWLKDYLYIPLGGNRQGKLKQYYNLFITMLLGGLWHGGSWNFMLWGGLHGTALGIDKWKNEQLQQYSPMRQFIHRYKKVLRIIGIVVTFHFVCFCWIFFKADTFDTSRIMINKIAIEINWHTVKQCFIIYNSIFIMLLFALVVHFLPKYIEQNIISKLSRNHLVYQCLLFITVVIAAIYFKQAEPILPVYLQF